MFDAQPIAPTIVQGVTTPHDVAQMLFYFVCVLGTFIGSVMLWGAKYIAIPVRDAGLEYLKNQTVFSSEVKAVLIEFGPMRQKLHDEAMQRFDRIEIALEKILREINAPPN
jgi:hypothetical protein